MRLSPSAISMFLECPAKFWFFVKKYKPSFIPEEYEFGAKLHKIVEYYYKSIPTEVTLSEIDIYIDNAIQKAFNLPYFQISGKYKFFRKYLKKFEKFRLSNNLRVVAVEKKGQYKYLVGIADLILQSPNGERIVVDWKSSTLKNSFPTYMQIQGCLYSYIFSVNKVIFFSLTAGNWEQITVSQCEKVAELLDQVFELIKQRHSQKKRGEWCKSCPYQIACWYQEIKNYLGEGYATGINYEKGRDFQEKT